MSTIKKQLSILPVMLAALVCILASPSHAMKITDNELVQGAKYCTRYINRYERRYAIPTHLLSAIASNESGRYHKGLKISVPWPWTINVKGKGYYFKTKKEAVYAVKKYRARGIKSIDVGCMQVNLYHHAKAFRSIEEAFEPKYNVAYAASFLSKLYKNAGSWKKAAGDYHSKTTSRGRKYAGSVYGRWQTIIKKLRAAKLSAGAPSRTVASASKPLNFIPVRKITKLSEQKGKQVARHQVPRMKVIELTKTSPARKATVIIKPAIRVVNTAPTVTIAQVEPAMALRVVNAVQAPTVINSGSSKIVRVNKLAPASGKPLPSFIFTN